MTIATADIHSIDSTCSDKEVDKMPCTSINSLTTCRLHACTSIVFQLRFTAPVFCILETGVILHG